MKKPDFLAAAGRGTLGGTVCEGVRKALLSNHDAVLHQPEFAGNEWAYVKECLDTGWVSSVGSYVARFEEMLCSVTGATYAVATVNGTAALHMCLLLTKVSRGEEVIVPALTFVATANAVSYVGATPHFVDSDRLTLGLDPSKLDTHLRDIACMIEGRCVNMRTGSVIKAVVAMHAFGHPVDMDALREVCARWRLALIEDAAESLGSYYKGRHTGTLGDIAALSFNGNKIVTTGGGGAILTNDSTLARQAKHLTTTARVSHRWSFLHDEIGYNYRLPNLNAALGCAQLEQLSGFVQRKRELARRYMSVMNAIPGVSMVAEPPQCCSNYWLNTLLLDGQLRDQRDEVLQALNEGGLMSRPAWTLMHLLPMFATCPRGDLSVAEDLAMRIINLPSSASLVQSDAR